MEKLRLLAKPVSHLVIFGMLMLSLPLPAAHAGMISTEAVVNAAQVQQDRERLRVLSANTPAQAIGEIKQMMVKRSV